MKKSWSYVSIPFWHERKHVENISTDMNAGYDRIAYGYRKINNDRSRLMIHFKFKAVKPSQQKTNIQAA